MRGNSYATWNATTGVHDLLYTCAQETCNQANTEHNAHQDMAYARMAYGKLLEYTDTRNGHNHSLDALPQHHRTGTGNVDARLADKRTEWAGMLKSLAPFVTVADPPSGKTVFAEADAWPGSVPGPSSNAGYSITRFAAIFPAMVVDTASPPDLLALGRDTVEVVNG